MSEVERLTTRVTELEIQLTHLLRHYEQLNQVVFEQSKDAESWQRRVTVLEQQIKLLKEKPQSSDRPEDEKPPHY